jgi:LysR family transcriptional regulator, glycine cleavage system transcriptional activator
MQAGKSNLGQPFCEFHSPSIGTLAMRHLPPLSSLRAFEATARLSSVSRAADELGRTHGAISKALKAVQDDIGTPLFDKAGTGLRANAAGLRLAGLIAGALATLGEGYDDLRREARAPSLHLACSASFAMGWLVPHLPGFSQAHPDVAIRLSMTSAREMRDEHEADLLVLWDRSSYAPQDQARAIRLGPARFGVVAAPGYPVAPDRDGVLRVPRQILHDHTARAWTEWSMRSGLRVAADETLSFPHTHLCLGAAAAGLGVAIGEARLAAADIAAGRLVPVSDFIEVPDGFVAIPHRSRPLRPAVRHVIDWLTGALYG